ncbi:MAG: hypothetical protein KKG93_10995 [Bacteroidetes bacterium]|nr:hypothetical protein [Bacteroidota bacterium]
MKKNLLSIIACIFVSTLLQAQNIYNSNDVKLQAPLKQNWSYKANSIVINQPDEDPQLSDLLKYYTLNGVGINWFAPSGEKLQDNTVYSVSTVHGFRRTDMNASGAIGLTYWFTPLENFFTVFGRFQRGIIFSELGKSFGKEIIGFTYFFGLTIPYHISADQAVVVDLAYGGIVGPMLIAKISYRL